MTREFQAGNRVQTICYFKAEAGAREAGMLKEVRFKNETL